MTSGPRLTVYIATTNGPVEVQRITEEDAEIDSVVCLAGKAMPLPISNAYQNFVRQPSGVIQRDFGHGSFRVDLSHTIEDGYSWQLGIYLSHAIVAADQLSGADKMPDHAVFISGEVNVDLDVLGVDHIARKLDGLRAKADELVAQGVQVTILLPAENIDAVPADWPHATIAIHGVTKISEAVEAIGLAPSANRQSPPPVVVPTTAPPVKKSHKKLAGIATLGSIVIGGLAGHLTLQSHIAPWEDLERTGQFRALDLALSEARSGGQVANLAATIFQKWMAGKRPDTATIRLRLIEHRPPAGKSCAAVRFGAVEARLVEAKRQSDRKFVESQFEDLCSLEFIVEADDDSTYLWGRYARWAAGSENVSDTAIKGPSRQSLRWKIDLPRHLRRDFDMSVIVMAGSRPIDGESGWIGQHVPPPGTIIKSTQWNDIVRTLAERGISIRDTSLRLKR